MTLAAVVGGLVFYLSADDSDVKIGQAVQSDTGNAEFDRNQYSINPAQSTWGGASYGLYANPFARLDCDPRVKTSACNPDETVDAPENLPPLIDVIRNLRDEIIQGRYSHAREIMSNLRECSERAASAERLVGFPAEPQGTEDSHFVGCDVGQARWFKREVETLLESAALGGDAVAKQGYAELLVSDVIEAFMVVSDQKRAGRDATAAEDAFQLSKTKAKAYLRSGMLSEIQTARYSEFSSLLE
jgi:hypothetical protein